FFSSRRRHTRCYRDWSSDVCSSDLHYEEHVAGSRWTGCRTDPFWTTEAPVIIRDRIVTELTTSKLFTRVSQAPSEPGDIVIRSEIGRASCRERETIVRGDDEFDTKS